MEERQIQPPQMTWYGYSGPTNPSTAKLTHAQNVALYSTFAVFGYFGGVFVNWLGVRACLAFGGSGYALYAIALLVSEHSTKVGPFNIVAGAILGVCAGLLWTAQGTVMISYPQENQKGRYFAWFWAIFNLGGVIGSLVSSPSVLLGPADAAISLPIEIQNLQIRIC